LSEYMLSSPFMVSSSATKGCFAVFVALTKQGQPQTSSFSSNLNDEDDAFAVLVAFTRLQQAHDGSRALFVALTN